MTYTEWRDELKNNLLSVSESERRRVLEYYAEAYADRRDAGFSEQEIVAQFGAPYDAAKRILSEEDGKEEPVAETPQPAPVRETPPVKAAPPAEAKKKKNAWWILALVCSLIGIGLIFILVLFALNGWRLTFEFETAQYTAEGEIEELRIDNGVWSIKTEFYDGDKVIVDYPVSDRYTMAVEEREGCLSLSGLNKKHWYNFSFLPANLPATVVKIPQGTVLKIDVTVNAGEVQLAAGEYADVGIEVNAGSLVVHGMVCTTFRCEVNAGSVSIRSLESASLDGRVHAGSFNAERVNCPLIRVHVSAGYAGLTVAGSLEEYTVSVDKSAGSCNISDRTGTDPAKKIDIDISAGSVNVSFA